MGLLIFAMNDALMRGEQGILLPAAITAGLYMAPSALCTADADAPATSRADFLPLLGCRGIGLAPSQSLLARDNAKITTCGAALERWSLRFGMAFLSATRFACAWKIIVPSAACPSLALPVGAVLSACAALFGMRANQRQHG